MKKEKSFFLIIGCLISLIICLAVIFVFSNWLIETNRNKMIPITFFTVDGKKDDMHYHPLTHGAHHNYKFTAKIKGDLLNKSNNDLYKIVLYRINGQRYKVYVNSFLVGSVGNPQGKGSNIWNSFNSFDIDKHLLKKKENEIQLNIYSTYGIGTTSFPIFITDPETAGKFANWFGFFVKTINAFTMGVMLFDFCLLIFLYGLSKKQQARNEYLYYAIGLLSMGVGILNYLFIEDVLIPFLLFKKVTTLALFLAIYFLSLAIYKQFRRRINLYMACALFIAIVSIGILTPDQISFEMYASILQLLAIINILSWVYVAYLEWKKSIDAKIVFLSALFLFVVSAYDSFYNFTGKYVNLDLIIFGALIFSTQIILLIIFNYLELQKQMAKENEKSRLMHEMAVKDGMTGLYNHQYILSSLTSLKKPYGLIMLDIDYFKKVNDTYGHHIGSSVLCYVAHEIKKSVNELAIVGRYGGDEFVAILPDTDKASLLLTTEKIKAAAEATHQVDGRIELKISLSIGVYLSQETEPGQNALSKADKALYKAKKDGRGQICIFTDNHQWN